MGNGLGYIALARSFIKDPRYRRPANRPLTEIEAIIWLISDVAWKPRALPTRFGAIHNDRSQFSTTERALAAAWNWSKSRVHRLLEELERDETIRIELRRPEPKSGPESKPQRGYARTLITLCNYDKFQKMAKWAKEAKGQRGNRNVDQKQPTIPGILRVAAEQPIKPPKTKESFGAEVERRIDDTKPRHRKDKMVGQNRIVFLDYGSEDWLTYAADYKTVTGTAIFPSIYLGGRGNWFFEQGEAVNPKRRRRKRA